MPNNNETTTKFKVDISELKSAMQDAKRQVQVTNSEFNAISSSMEDWTKSADGLQAKLNQLDSNLNSQKKILRSLEDQYELTVQVMGEGSAEADRLKIAINNQQAVINKTEKELESFNDELKHVEKAELEAVRNGRDVNEVLEEMENSTENAGEGFTTLKGTMANLLAEGLKGLIGGVKDLVSNFVDLAESTREYREDIGKLETAFANSKVSVDDAKETYKDFYSVLGEEDRSVEAVNHLANFVDSQKDLAKWTDICTGVWGTFGDSLPIEGLTEASNETMKTGKLTGVLADALNWAGVNEDDFQAKLDKCTNEQERQALITDTLNGLYSESADAYRENNASVIEANKANSDYTDALAKMGETIEPITTTVKQGFTDLLNEALKLVEDVDFEAFKDKVEDAFTVLKDEVLPAVKDGLGWIIDHKDELIAGIAGIGTALAVLNVANMIMGLVKAFQAFKVAQEGATVAQWLLNTAMSANPIGIIVALIAGLVTAFIVLWNNSEEFRNFWIELWEGIKSAVGTAVDGIVKFFTETIPNAFNSVIEWIKTNWQAILLFLINPFAGLFKYFYDNNAKFHEFVDNAVNVIKELPSKVWEWLLATINKINEWRVSMITKAQETAMNFVNSIVTFFSQLPSKIWTWLTNVITKVTTWAKDLAKKGKTAGKDLIDAIVNKVKELPDKMKDLGKDIVEGLWNGIDDMTEWLGNKIKSFCDNALDAIKNFFGIHSPSKVMEEEVGKWLPAGIAVGIDKNAKSVMSAMKDLTMNTLGATRDGLNEIGINGGIAGGVVNNFTQINNSPKALSRLEIYRQSKNLLGYAGGGM